MFFADSLVNSFPQMASPRTIKTSKTFDAQRKTFMTMYDRLLRTRQESDALGVSPSTIKRWVVLGILRASRTVGKHRLIASSETLRFARQRGMPHARLGGVDAVLGSPGAID